MKRNEHAIEMVQMYQDGKTLQEIGQQFGITRSRVQQIVSRHGLSRQDGGQAIKLARQKVKQLAEKEKNKTRRQAQRKERYKIWITKRLGATEEEILAAGFPTEKHHPICKKYLTIQFIHQYTHHQPYMDYLDWCRIWQKSGHLDMENGPENGWCLLRVDSTAGWTRDNMEVVRSGSWLHGRTKTKLPSA